MGMVRATARYLLLRTTYGKYLQYHTVCGFTFYGPPSQEVAALLMLARRIVIWVQNKSVCRIRYVIVVGEPLFSRHFVPPFLPFSSPQESVF